MIWRPFDFAIRDRSFVSQVVAGFFSTAYSRFFKQIERIYFMLP